MKKVLTAILSLGVMATSSFALEGTIGQITITATVKQVQCAGTKKNINSGNAEQDKAFLAAAMSAQATGATVTCYHDGTNWTVFSVAGN